MFLKEKAAQSEGSHLGGLQGFELLRGLFPAALPLVSLGPPLAMGALQSSLITFSDYCHTCSEVYQPYLKEGKKKFNLKTFAKNEMTVRLISGHMQWFKIAQ